MTVNNTLPPVQQDWPFHVGWLESQLVSLIGTLQTFLDDNPGLTRVQRLDLQCAVDSTRRRLEQDRAMWPGNHIARVAS